MGKKNNYIVPISIAIAVIIIGFVGVNYFGLIENALVIDRSTIDGQLVLKEKRDSGEVICQSDICVVYGEMTVDKGKLVDTFSCSPCLVNNGKNAATVLVNSGKYESVVECTGQAVDNPTSIVKAFKACKGSTTMQYGATFNFCGEKGSKNFCIGGKDNSITLAGNYFTDDIILNRQEKVTFTPQNIDGAAITKRFIHVENYDASCKNAITRKEACIPGQISCINGKPTQYLKCEGTKSFGSVQCDIFGIAQYTVPSGQQCFLLDSAGKLTTSQGDGIGGISCPGTNNCALSDKIGTTGSTSYKECTQVGSCNSYVDKTCPSGLVFDSVKDSCEIPSNTQCDPKVSYCEGNAIVRCEAVTISDKPGYALTEPVACLSAEPFCTIIISEPQQAACAPAFEDVEILSEDSYAIGALINNIVVRVNSSAVSGSGLSVTGQIFEGTVAKKNAGGTTNTKGEALINFNYAHPRSGTLKMVFTIKDPKKNVSVSSEKIITIQKAMTTKLSCPFSTFINRDVSCTVRYEDSETKKVISGSLKATVMQGDTDIIFNYESAADGTSGIKFKSKGTTGAITVKVIGEKEGYLSDEDETTIAVNDVALGQKLYIDNKEYAISGSSVSTGTHTLKLTIDESGAPAAILAVTAELSEPSGKKTPLSFTKASDGSWSASASLTIPATNYILKGVINPTDINTGDVLFEYNLQTLGQKTESETSTLTGVYVFLGVLGGLIVLLVVGIIFVRRGRKKR